MELKDIISSGILELYVSGQASDIEAAQAEKWALIHPEVRQEMVNIQDALEFYANSESIQPDPAIKEKIFNKIGSRVRNMSLDSSDSIMFPASHGVIRSFSNWYKYAAAISIILLVVSAFLTYDYYNKYHEANDKLQLAETQLKQESELAKSMHTDIDVMSNKFSLPVVLNGTPGAPDALAKIFWMKNSGEVWVDAVNLPDLPAGKQYQLWGIVGGKPIDAGMINTSKGILHLQRMKSFGKAEAFAITMEKSGGSPTPTMEKMVVIAKI